MDDLDLLKAIPSEVVKSAYDDAVSPVLKETGKFGQDILKTLRLVFFPVQYAAALQDRLAKHLERSIARVPEERRVAPVESLALPIADQFKFHDEQSVVGQMFERLLSRAMDRERVGEAHPAFVQIVGQLAPDEAVLIKQIADARPAAYMRPPKKGAAALLNEERVALIKDSGLSEDLKGRLSAAVVRPEELAQPELVYTYIEHLVSLGIAAYTNEPWQADFQGAQYAGFDFWFIELNGLGRLFHRACLVDD
ncbi:Abi-alpha family protein [Paraburkholderia sp. FT54]|uniref:Abi-alpha family protein n=1 Tax=Paraburkholderia sp. FT54 TaxID=3074437 RepID=UPI0028775195|nr:Abi-alpha family protein [Paraburkholderia sp. FT54]WNC94383.1 Abi-alpha family protein [Paraburkholderia sp. FT54]